MGGNPSERSPGLTPPASPRRRRHLGRDHPEAPLAVLAEPLLVVVPLPAVLEVRVHALAVEALRREFHAPELFGPVVRVVPDGVRERGRRRHPRRRARQVPAVAGGGDGRADVIGARLRGGRCGYGIFVIASVAREVAAVAPRPDGHVLHHGVDLPLDVTDTHDAVGRHGLLLALARALRPQRTIARAEPYVAQVNGPSRPSATPASSSPASAATAVELGAPAAAGARAATRVAISHLGIGSRGGGGRRRLAAVKAVGDPAAAASWADEWPYCRR